MIHSQHGSALKFILFSPLFPRNGIRHPSHPRIPQHNILPIAAQEIGSENVELYATQQWNFIEEKAIIQPAFVFTLNEFKQPENRWAHGIKNVFVVRFAETYDSPRQLIAVKQDDRIAFPDQFRGRIFDEDALCQMSCFSYTSFKGIHSLQRAISKSLNKRTGSSEQRDTAVVTTGPITTETWKYVKILSLLNGIKVHRIVSVKESYLDIHRNFTRRIIQMEGPGQLIRFQTHGELQFLRDTLGFGSSYGTLTIRPTLKDGVNGTRLKRHHRITFIKGQNEEVPFSRITKNQRVDLLKTDSKFRLTVSYERYGYDLNANGSLLNEPPTEHLSQLLHGRGPDEEEDSYVMTGPIAEFPNIVEGCLFQAGESVNRIITIDVNINRVKCVVTGGQKMSLFQIQNKDPWSKKYLFEINDDLDHMITDYN